MRSAPALGEPIEAGGEDVAGQSSSLVGRFGAHGFDEPGGRLGVVPEQPVRGDVVAAVVDHEVEVGPVQRGLTKAGLWVGVVALRADHVMRTGHRLQPGRQPIALGQRADRRSSVGGQPRLDDSVVGDRETMTDQHLTEDVVRAVDLEGDGVDPGVPCVSEPALHHVSHPVRRGVGHDHRVELHPRAGVGRDHGGLRATARIEPEELRDVVGRARPLCPPPLEVGGFVQPCRGVRAADPLQQHRHLLQGSRDRPDALLARSPRGTNLRRRDRAGSHGCGDLPARSVTWTGPDRATLWA